MHKSYSVHVALVTQEEVEVVQFVATVLLEGQKKTWNMNLDSPG
jgi:hypothetical protein